MDMLMEATKEKTLHTTACHEAAHAVMAWLSGDVLKAITIEGREPGKPFLCTHGRSSWREQVWLNRNNVHITLAGAAVQSILGLDDPFDGCTSDLKSIADMLTHPDDETKSMREFAVHHPDTTAREFAELFLPDLVDRLKDPKAMTCIEAGAAALETFGTVCGQFMAGLFETCYGDSLPEGVAPAWMHWPPDKADEPPNQAEALALLSKAMEALEKAIEATRTAFSFENDQAEILAARTIEHGFWMRDQFQKIEIQTPA